MIAPIGPAPSPLDPPSVFNDKAFAMLTQLPVFAEQANTTAADMQLNADVAAVLITAMALPQFMGTSTSSLAIGTGAKSFATQAGKAWVVGQVVIASNGSNYMKGQVSAYNSGTGVLDVLVGSVAGSGTFASWTIGLSYEGLSLAKSGVNSDITSLTALEGPGLLPVGTIVHVPYNTLDAGFMKANGAAVSRTVYAALFAKLVKSSTATMTIATPGVVTWTAHGRSANDTIKFQTTGALPTGFVAGITYYVVGGTMTANTFQLSATAGGAAITTTGTQSGVHTAIHAPFGDGNGSTTFNLPEGRAEFPRGWDDGRGIDSGRVFGTTQLDDFKAHTHGIGSTQNVDASGGVYPSNISASNSIQSSSVGGSETRPRNLALMACIKY